MSDKYFKLADEQSGTSSQLLVREGSEGPAVIDIGKLYREHGVFTFDPGFVATASCESKITYIDGEKGVLLYRGYPVGQLAAQSNFLEVAYLLLAGELPSVSEQIEFTSSIMHHTMINETLLRFFNGFHFNAHPMAMVSGVVGSMSAFYHDSMDLKNPEHRQIFSHRIIAKMPTIAAAAYKHSVGQPFIYPRNDLDYCSNLLNMFFAVPCEDYDVDPVAAEALDLLFILHADHEQNCSTSTVRLAGSSGTNPYAAIAAGVSALWGPAHGGANEAVLKMLAEIGSADNVKSFIDQVKNTEDDTRLMGFGHRVYKNYDPRAKVLQKNCHEVLDSLGIKHEPLLEIAVELEKIALSDEYFIERKLFPNVDFYSGIILKAMGIPTSMFTVLFALARTVGWIAQWKEMVEDPSQKLGRPRQLYTGPTERHYVPLHKR